MFVKETIKAKMKKSFIISCAVFICLPLTIGDNISAIPIVSYECIEQYLQIKGKLGHRVPTTTRLSFCLARIQAIVRITRDAIETTINNEIPMQKECLMNEIDDKEMIDLWLQLKYAEYASRFNKQSSNSERIFQKKLRMSGQDLIKAIASSCGVTEDELNVMIHISLFE